MGGFILDVSPLHDYQGIMTLTHHAALALSKDGLFLPMPDDSIHDKSKADYLAKALVFFQVFFLVVQVSARKAQALPISLLEIHALVRVVCAAGMYVAWFGKPLDIKDPTDISHNVRGNSAVETGLRWQKTIAEILVQSRFLTTWSNHAGSDPESVAETFLATNYASFPTCHGQEAEFISVTSTQRDEAQLVDSNFDGLPLKFCTKELASAIIALEDANPETNREEKARTSERFSRFSGPPWYVEESNQYYTCTPDGINVPVAPSLISGCALISGVGPATYPSSFSRLHFSKKALQKST